MSWRVGILFLYLNLMTRESECDFVNVAQNKPANMSSTQGEGSLSAGEAVDGVITTVKPHVITTISGQTSAWWTVDLGKDVQAAKVEIHFRTDYKYRRHGLNLYTSTEEFSANHSQLCHAFRGRPDGTDIPDVVNVTCPGRWRYLTVFTSTDNDGDGPVLDFGEVRVLACHAGFYGPTCSLSCTSRHCNTSDDNCDAVTGSCSVGCQVGWTGADCRQVCQSARYGEQCSMPCSTRKCRTKSLTCDHVTGWCSDGCQDGWRSLDCTLPCHAGSYGPNCSLLCARRHCNKSDGICDVVTGSCSGACELGWMGVDCTQECLAGSYGPNCSKLCSNRHCSASNTTCGSKIGECFPGGCETGYWGQDCTLECIAVRYGVNCLQLCSNRHCMTSSDTCHHVTGSCTDGCENGWKGEDCIQEHPGVSNVSAGLIGGLVGMVVMLILIGVIFLCYIRMKRGSRSGIADTRAERDKTVINPENDSLYSYLHSNRGTDSRPESVSYLYVRQIQEL